LLLLGTAAAFAQQPAEPVSITPINGDTYYLINQGTGFQVDLNGGALTAGTAAVATTRSFTSLTQRWALTAFGSSWKISNISSGLCLDASVSSSTASTVDNTCGVATTQQWILAGTSNGYYTLTNVGTGKVLDTASNAANSALVQTTLGTAATQSQQWLLRPAYFRGVDNALLEKQEANKVTNGVPWWNDAEVKGDLLQILKNHGVNMIRIRPTSEPPYSTFTTTTCSGNGCYAETDTQDINLALRARNLGMSVELSLLYDGGSSVATPSAWSSNTLATLESNIYTYVKSEVEAFRSAGAMPDMVSIGNEVNTGFLSSLNTSPNSNFSNFGAVQQQALQAVADAASDTSIGPALPTPLRCIHITPSYNLSSFFNNANSHGITNYEAMCQSYYPLYHGPLTQAQANTTNPQNQPVEQPVLQAAATAIGKPIFLIEVGEHYENGFDSNDPWYPATIAGQRQFLIDVTDVTRTLPNNLGMGIEYWDATGVNVYINGGGYSNGDGKIDALYTWNGLTLFDNADTQGYANANLANYSSTLPGLDALGGKLDPTLNYKLVNKATGQILETTVASTAANSALDTTADTGIISQHQYWTITSNGDGYFQIGNGNTSGGSNVLDADQGATSGAAVVQNTVASTITATQEWNILTASGGYYAIVNRNSGLVLGATSAAAIQQTSASGVAQDWVIAASSNQLWQIVPAHITAPSTATNLAFAAGTPTTLTTGNSLGNVQVNVTNTAGAIIGLPAASITLALTGPQTTSQTVASSSGSATFNLSSLTLTQPGAYTLTASAAGFSIVSAIVIVSYPVLTVTASNATRSYGAANPALTYTVTGFVNGDNSSILTGAPTLSTTAGTASPVATYPIAISAGTLQTSSNYTFSYVNGTLTVSQAASTAAITAPANYVTLGHSITFNGTAASTTSGTPTGSLNFSSGATGLGSGTLTNGATTFSTTALPSGADTISAQYGGDTNFLSSFSNSLSIRVSPQHVWIANGGGSVSEAGNSGAAINAGISGGGSGVAVDNAGNVWSASSSGALSEFSNTGAALGTYNGGGISAPAGVAIDGSGSVWIVNGNGTLSAFTNGGVAVSPAAGYTGAGLNAPTSVVIDSSGSVWVANSGNSTVTRVLGAADPVVTPLSTAVQNATLGAKP
jgi:arabinogalactan endo-1,4-beta-galactosidase